MLHCGAKYNKILKLNLLAGLLCTVAIFQARAQEHRVSTNHIQKGLSDELQKPVRGLSVRIIPRAIATNKDRVFLDSLEKKASKSRITKKLYDIMIVVPDSTNNKKLTGTSQSAYVDFAGKRIRNISIRRLNVFGVDINNPEMYHPGQMQSLLNRTHVNTNESIIRKNLIFSAGDTLSPIALSDNERILRDLPFIDDARINVVPVTQDEVDVVVTTKDVYSLGGSFNPSGIKKGSFSVFENNILGTGHELGIEMPYDNTLPGSPGFGIHYLMDNIDSSFINMKLYFNEGLGQESYGFDLSRKLVSSSTKYAGGISVRHMSEKVDLDSLRVPEPFRYNFQDYWISRSVMLNRFKVTRLIFGLRYTNNYVFDRPFILPDSYHSMQKYRLFLGSVALSVQNYYKTNLIYGYGRTEDIPYGGLMKVTIGREINEFSNRNYAGSEISYSNLIGNFGYLYSSTGLGAYIADHHTEQGILAFRMKYFSNLLPLGRSMIRNFVTIDYTRGFDRNIEEHLKYIPDNGFSGFRNDSIIGTQRVTLNLETVVFSRAHIYGFRMAFFGFADFAALSGTNQVMANGTALTGIGAGVRVRNDNLVFNTFQIRIGFFPNPPSYSRINYVTFSGEHLLRMENFESGPPAMIPYR
jgi:hypothetical protein